jgi:hypothetical protein
MDEKRNITFHLMKVLVQGWNRSTQMAQTTSSLALCHGDRQMTNEIERRDRILTQLKKNANAWNIRFKYINKSDNEINFSGIPFRANTSSKLQWRIDPKVDNKMESHSTTSTNNPKARHDTLRLCLATRAH